MFWLGKILIFAGLTLTVIGGVFMLSDKISWIGRLPGDILIKKENMTFYFPLMTSLILSLIFSVILFLFGKK